MNGRNEIPEVPVNEKIFDKIERSVDECLARVFDLESFTARLLGELPEEASQKECQVDDGRVGALTRSLDALRERMARVNGRLRVLV